MITVPYYSNRTFDPWVIQGRATLVWREDPRWFDLLLRYDAQHIDSWRSEREFARRLYSDRRPNLFFDISHVFRPADRVAFQRGAR